MFCYKCGKQIEDGALYCEYCGTKQNTFSEAETGREADHIDVGDQPSATNNDTSKDTTGKKLNKKLLIGLVGGVVILCVALFVVLTKTTTNQNSQSSKSEKSDEKPSVTETMKPDESGFAREVTSTYYIDSISFQEPEYDYDDKIIDIDAILELDPEEFSGKVPGIYLVSSFDRENVHTLIIDMQNYADDYKKVAVDSYGFDKDMEIILSLVIPKPNSEYYDHVFTVYSDRDYFREANGMDYEKTPEGRNDFIDDYLEYAEQFGYFD